MTYTCCSDKADLNTPLSRGAKLLISGVPRPLACAAGVPVVWSSAAQGSAAFLRRPGRPGKRVSRGKAGLGTRPLPSTPLREASGAARASGWVGNASHDERANPYCPYRIRHGNNLYAALLRTSRPRGRSGDAAPTETPCTNFPEEDMKTKKQTQRRADASSGPGAGEDAGAPLPNHE